MPYFAVMSQQTPPPAEPGGPPPAAPRRAARARIALIASLVAVAVLVGALLWWSPWQSEESAAAACPEDATHFADQETGLCFGIPEDWVRVDEAELGESDYTLVVESDSGNAWAGTRPVPQELSATDPEDAARKMISVLAEVGADAPMQIDTGSLDGHDSAVVELKTVAIWYQVIAVEVDGDIVMMLGSTFSGEDGLIEQVEQVHDSLSLA